MDLSTLTARQTRPTNTVRVLWSICGVDLALQPKRRHLCAAYAELELRRLLAACEFRYIRRITMARPTCRSPCALPLSAPIAKQVPLVAMLAQNVCVRQSPAPGIEHMGERSVGRSCICPVHRCPETGLSEQRRGDVLASARGSIGLLRGTVVEESRGGRTTSSSACGTAPQKSNR